MSRSTRVEEEYRNVTTQFRTLTEIRFKLLGLLPLGTAAALLLAKDDGGSPPLAARGHPTVIGAAGIRCGTRSL